MADPTIETFCCQRSTMLNESLGLLMHFNSKSYNAVCLASSSVGILGAIYQILPRESPTLSHRWYSSSATRGRHIIVWLAVADLLASLGVFLRSFMFNYESDIYSWNNVLCAMSSAWIQYFYTATWLWTLCYAIDMKLVLREEDGHPLLYHSIVWIVPAIFTVIGFSAIYFPDANCQCNCSIGTIILRLLPNYIATYFPLAIVMILNPIVYFSLSHDIRRIVTTSFAQFTSRERQIIDLIKVKFLLINFAFYLCWLPNLLNGILIWSLWFSTPKNMIIMLWYVMALMNPLQAVFNCLLYRRWTGASEKVYLPFRNENNCIYQLCKSQTSVKITPNESTPLISPSINSTCTSTDQHIEL